MAGLSISQRCIATVTLLVLVHSSAAHAQVYVYPRRPDQSNVRYADFQWRTVDIKVGHAAEPDSGNAKSTSQLSLAPRHSFHHGLPEPWALPVWGSAMSGAKQGSGPNAALQGATSRLSASAVEPTGDPGSRERADVALVAPDGGESTSPSLPVVPGVSPDRPSAAATPSAGGVRLYFYEREREVAARAAAFIESSYEYLVDAFSFTPNRTLPYVLYNSYTEFLQTNLFPIQEGVLGVTSRRDLQLALPYFGDHRLFQHVSTHEMVHQFTIQKAREVADAAGISADPLDRVPLWFIEGIAEFYAHRGIDPETDMLARDLLLNPDPTKGYVILDFFEDRPYSGLWTYKIGQIRAAFLEETYGKGTLQRVLESSPRLVTSSVEQAPMSFRGLLVAVCGDDSRTISARFETWLKRRVYPAYLASQQDSPDVIPLNHTKDIIQTMALSPDGTLMLYRAIQPETGQVRLFLTDTRAPDRHRQVAADGTPGIESLHPVGGRTFDIVGGRIVFLARAQGQDVLYIQEFKHTARAIGGSDDKDSKVAAQWEVDIKFGRRLRYPLKPLGLLAADSPALAPDGRRIALMGLDEDGQKDLYVFEPVDDTQGVLSRLTRDVYAERGTHWGDKGIVFTSDATGHGYYNLFHVDPTPATASKVQRLTFDARDQFDAVTAPSGEILFSSYEDGRANIYRIADTGVMRRTDIVTGLFDAHPAPDGALWAMFHHKGQRQPVRLPPERLLSTTTAPVPSEDTPRELLSAPLNDATDYALWSVRNWEIANIFGLLGASSGGVYGQVLVTANDRLKNHALMLNAMAFGSLERTDAALTYINQQRRLIWAAGLFQDVRFRVDDTFDDLPRFLAGERFYGVQGTVRYPFDRFTFIQGELGLGGSTFFLPESTRDYLKRQPQDEDPESRIDRWNARHEGARLQVAPTLGLGYNTLRYHPGTGPIGGSAVLLENSLALQPFAGETHGTLRLDAEIYFPLYSRINFSLRGGAGTAYGGQFARQFYLSSFDTLRGVPFGDTDYLLGRNFLFTKAELRFPLNFLISLPMVDIEGVVGGDFGGVGENVSEAWDRRVLAFVAGTNFGLGPIVLRLHFARPFDIGPVAVPNGGDWVTNFSLGWRYW